MIIIRIPAILTADDFLEPCRPLLDGEMYVSPPIRINKWKFYPSCCFRNAYWGGYMDEQFVKIRDEDLQTLGVQLIVAIHSDK